MHKGGTKKHGQPSLSVFFFIYSGSIYAIPNYFALFVSLTGMVTTATVPFSELVTDRLPPTMLCSRSLTFRIPTWGFPSSI